MALDADTGKIIAHALIDRDAGSASKVEPLVDQIDTSRSQVAPDEAYDGGLTYGAVANYNPESGVIIQPRANAVERKVAAPCS